MDDETRQALRELAAAIQDVAHAVNAAAVPVRRQAGVSAAKATGKAQGVLDRLALGPF